MKTKAIYCALHKVCLSLTFLLSLASLTFAQQPIHSQSRIIHLRNGSIRARRNIADASFRKDSLRADHFNRHYYALAQFDLLPDSVHKLEMANAGIRLFDYVSDGAYLVELDDSFGVDVLKRYAISGVFPLPARSKISSRLQQHGNEDVRDPGRLIAVGYFGSTPADVVRQGIVAAGARIETLKLQPPRVFFVRAGDTAVLRRLSELPYVSYLTSQPFQPKPLNYNNRAAQGADALGASSGRNLYGDGVVIGVGDNADPSTHVDFTGRLINRTPAPVDDHGTHTAGSLAGGGILNPMYQGMAPHATLVTQFFSDILANAPIYLNDYDMLLTSNSYTDYDKGCANDGDYDALAYATDAQIYQYWYLLHVFASGNDGNLTCSPYPGQYATIKSGFQAAKNALTVGAIDNTNGSSTNTYLINGYSSAGPTADGRLKPEVVAGGVNVVSTLPHNSYGIETGTSMATPDVTGTLALLVQRCRQVYGGDPPSELLKALVCNTANDLGNPGPDYMFGFGSLNGLAAAQAMDARQFQLSSVSNGGAFNYDLTVPAGLAQVRIMAYWNDYPGAPYAATALVNNLDLTVQDPSATVHHPLVLNSAAGHVTDNAVEGVDNLNNIEQVVVNNPSGGTYHCSVAGTSVPYGPQDFVLVWQFIQPSIVVQYPYGNEKLVPGQPEVIRWNAYDGGANQFTIDYSTDNGSTWTTISSTVPANSQMYTWTTPSTATNQALVRVTRNSTAYSGQSTYPFTILDQPTLTGTSPCQGYAQLSWNTVASATSYDIMQLIGDTMVKVANTTSTGYLLGGLNKDSSYWLGVRAVNGSTFGRRSISVNIQPSGGACTLAALDNDYTVDSAIGLSSGRLYTSSQLTSTTPIKVEVKNLGTIPTGSSFTMNYSINGGTPVSETSNASVSANGGAYDYTFTTPADLSAQGTYTLQIWVGYPGDPQHGNDTLTTTIKQLSNDPVTLSPSYTEGLESAADGSYSPGTMGFTGLDRCDFYSTTHSSTATGRVRTFVNSDMCRTGNRCAILDQAPTDTSTRFSPTADSLIMTFNLSSYTSTDQLWLDFYYRNQGCDSVFGGNKVWIRGNDQAAWVEVCTLDTSLANIGIYQPSAHIDITGTLRNATPTQSISSSFQIKFGEQGRNTANDVYTDGTVDDGYIFDDITLSRSMNDIGLVKLVSPAAGNQCSLSSATAISVLVKNYTSTAATNIPVSYVFNGNTVTEYVPSLNGNDSVVYTFTTTADMSAYQTYTISASVNYPGDTYASNNAIPAVTMHTSPLVSTFPYLEGFESSDGNWFTGGVNSSWQWGAPQKTAINKAANGSNCWVTSLTGDYNNGELSYLYSPCFDLSSLASPVFSFSHIFQTEDGCDCDYHWVEYSTDDSTWI
ncbi:MAG TPA: S8 family serine peptidase, partial [Puia sp.]|nr:S8 family serine peptidase [Puia sp.]